MKKKNGFTLIELLAVIVILAIVALVATPIVLNVINSSREKARLSSAYGIVDAARLKYIQTKYEGGTVSSDNLLSSLEVGGEKPTGSVYVNDNGEIAVALVYDNTRCYKKGYSDSALTLTTVEVGGECVAPLPPITVAGRSFDVVTSGDGLYLEATDGTYRYKGNNPANYIRLFDDHDGMSGIYRIISISNQGIKVISDQYINKSWDVGNYVAVADCTDETCPRNDANNTYCQVTSGTYGGCNAWSAVPDTYTNGSYSGTVTEDSAMLIYLRDNYYENNLTGISSKIVENAVWNVGPISFGFNKALSTLLGEEDNNTWTGKIGLINPSDYVMAQIPGESSTSCYASTILNSTCGKSNTNWLKTSDYYWTMNAYASGADYVYHVENVGYLNYSDVYVALAARPVVFLKNDISLGNESGVDAEHAITIIP